MEKHFRDAQCFPDVEKIKSLFSLALSKLLSEADIDISRLFMKENILETFDSLEFKLEKEGNLGYSFNY